MKRLSILLVTLATVGTAVTALAQTAPARPPDAGAAVAAPADPDAAPADPDAAPADPDAERAAAVAHLRFGLEELARLQAADASRVTELEARRPVAGTATVTPAALEEQTARITALEERLAALTTALEASDQAREELEESTFEALARRITVSGYSTSYFTSTDTRAASFRAFRFNLMFDARITQRLRFFGEVEFEDAARVGEGAGVLEVEQAFFELTIGKALELRAGVLLAPFGYYNRLHEGWRFAFTARPLVNQDVFPSTYADVGLSAQGALSRGEQHQLRYEIALVNGLNGNLATSLSGEALRDARPGFEFDENASPAYIGHLHLLLSDVFEVGVSGYYGRYAASVRAAMAMAGADLMLNLGRFTLRAEGAYVWVQAGGRALDLDGNPATPAVVFRYPDALLGAVVEAELQFWPRALRGTFLGDFDDPTFFVAARFDAARLVWSTPQDELIVTGSIGYRPIHQSAVRIEFAKGFGNFGRKNGWQFTVAFAMGY